MTTTVTRDFSSTTRKALAAKGITVLRPVALTSCGDGRRAYSVDDNGTGRVLDFLTILAMVA